MPTASRTARFSTRARLRPALGAFLLGWAAAACHRSQAAMDRPQATLAASSEAQRAFRPLRSGWFAGSSSERRQLEPDLRAFLARFPGDERSDTVRVLLAFDCASRGALPEARALLARVREHVGSVNDFSRVAEAYARLREAQPDAAWQLLEPLAGKIVDPDERLVYSEVRLRAAISAHRFAHALIAAEELLAEAPPESQSGLQDLVRELFLGAPKSELVDGFAVYDRPQAEGSVPSPAHEWLRKMLRERLVTLAVREQDASLARSLLDTAPAALRASSNGSALVGIAGGVQSMPLILGRSIGIALSLSNPDTRRRSAGLAAGLARALGSASAMNQPGAVHLISQDDGGRSTGTAEALRELAAEGAAILVAGVDGPSADEAARFAEEHAIAVLLAQPPETLAGPFQYTFVVGESSNDEQAAIDAELSRRGLQRIARVGRSGEPCDVPVLSAGSERFSVQQWRRNRVSALLVLGSAGCASDVAHELRGAAFAPALVLGLEAAEFVYASDAPAGRFALGAGSFPSPKRLDAAANPALPALDWYEALGHDAALLAQVALQGFPDGRVDDARVVRELHERAARALAAAHGALWTSEARGFSATHVLPRSLNIVAPGSPPRSSP